MEIADSHLISEEGLENRRGEGLGIFKEELSLCVMEYLQLRDELEVASVGFLTTKGNRESGLTE